MSMRNDLFLNFKNLVKKSNISKDDAREFWLDTLESLEWFDIDDCEDFEMKMFEDELEEFFKN
jgi:polyhydroxyalkanoate synthesis regulator phasin